MKDEKVSIINNKKCNIVINENSVSLIKTADEMFEKLGTTKTETESFITYTGKLNKLARVLFDKKNKSIMFEEFNAIDIYLLKAINKKCEELRLVR